MTRLKPYFREGVIEAGLDEAGRGCLAGPVVAAAVILKPNFSNDLINDSKQLNVADRNKLRKIIEKKADCFGVGVLDNHQIDEFNILKASFKAMNIGVSKLTTNPELLLIDGNRFYPETDIPFECIIKGDAKYLSIAAASIIAKTYRDEIMDTLHEEFPVYNWKSNKGYPTKEHRNAIREHGPSPYHRMSFRLLNDEKQLEFDF